MSDTNVQLITGIMMFFVSVFVFWMYVSVGGRVGSSAQKVIWMLPFLFIMSIVFIAWSLYKKYKDAKEWSSE